MRSTDTESHELPLSGGTSMDVQLTVPERDSVASEAPLPAVIVIHDILGFSEDTRRICRRLASGPLALLVAAPNLYQGLGPKPICVARTISSLKKQSGVTFERLAAVHDFVAMRPDVDPERIAVVGFCIGGGFALLYAARAKVAVVAPFYGDVPNDPDAIRNLCPLVGGYGERDSIFAPQGRRLARQLERQNTEHDLVFYPDAGHSYMNQLQGIAKLARYSPLRAEYREADAEDSWRRVFEFFAKHL